MLKTIAILAIVPLLATCLAVVVLLTYGRPSTETRGKASVQIVVLGDIGHSPRMQYHALSIAQHGGHAELVGFRDSEPIEELQQHPLLSFAIIPSTPRILQTSNKLLFLATAPLKVLYQVWVLWKTLAYSTSACEWMLVQNPPSIPTLLITALVCRLRKTKLVIDWHNFGYSILALKLGSDHPLVAVSRLYERLFAKFAYCHFTVTDAMKSVLIQDIGITQPVFTLHDRPAPLFKPLSPDDRAAFLTKCALTAEEASDILGGRTRLMVSSTSWTPDEDFAVLLEALCNYSASAVSDSPQLPELLVIITGKGPLKHRYLETIKTLEAKQELEMITVKTAWLSFDDYASLLGAADLGVSLHTSSSGVDLPMKVVDMFGAGLPVLGYSAFRAWPELVHEGIDGKGFKTAEEMATLLRSLLNPPTKELDKLKRGALLESKRRWNDEWDPVAGKLFGLTS